MSQAPYTIPPGRAGALIRHYKMEVIPHEGAWFALRWVAGVRVAGEALPERYGGAARPAGNAIVALVTHAYFSAMHRLRTDETWHFYGGDPAEMLLLHPDGRAERRRLGGDVLAGEEPQVTVPAGTWMGARPARAGADSPAEALAQEGAYSFFGCTLAPGFDYADYEPGWRDELVAGWPAEAELIAALTREDSLTRPAWAAEGARERRQECPRHDLASGVIDPAEVPAIAAGPGVTLRELAGRVGRLRTEAMSCARFRLEPGATTGASRYHGSDEFFVVLTGRGVVTLNGVETAVRAGSVVAIERGEPHALRADADEALEFLALIAPAFNPAHYAPERETNP